MIDGPITIVGEAELAELRRKAAVYAESGGGALSYGVVIPDGE